MPWRLLGLPLRGLGLSRRGPVLSSGPKEGIELLRGQLNIWVVSSPVVLILHAASIHQSSGVVGVPVDQDSLVANKPFKLKTFTLASKARLMSSGITLFFPSSFGGSGAATAAGAATSAWALPAFFAAASFAIDAASLDPVFSFGAASAWLVRGFQIADLIQFCHMAESECLMSVVTDLKLSHDLPDPIAQRLSHDPPPGVPGMGFGWPETDGASPGRRGALSAAVPCSLADRGITDELPAGAAKVEASAAGSAASTVSQAISSPGACSPEGASDLCFEVPSMMLKPSACRTAQVSHENRSLLKG
ncbi:MAG: hypothetical protein FRX49_04670 [Trebouxia sp. A1-2]|nr:MAG: hypothetical protein FRX49_04670 [Trebouxia sp. A1-2]